MPIDVKFAYVCRFKFTDLPGDSDHIRHCNQCNLDVTNLDLMQDDAAEKFLQDAKERQKRVCVSATVRLPDANQCLGGVFVTMAGLPVLEPISLSDIEAVERAYRDFELWKQNRQLN